MTVVSVFLLFLLSL